MATPIKSTSNPSGLNGTATPPALADLMSRLNAQQAFGNDAQSQQQAFARWMDKHAMDVPSTPAQSGAPTPPTTASKSPSSHATDTQRLAEQALARTRQQSAVAAHHSEPVVAKAPTEPASRSKADAAKASPKNAPAKSASADKPGKADKSADAAKAREADEAGKADEAQAAQHDEGQETPFTTAAGDGAAVVRELTPPPTIQAGDSASMMAWLASLTNSDLAQGQGGELAQGGNNALGGSGQGAEGKGADMLHDKAGASPGGITLDSPVWRSTGGTAALQVDALLGQPGKAAEAKAEGDPLASLLSGGALKGASFGQTLSEATQVRHESATLPTPVNSPDFAQALAEKVSMWVSSARTDGSMTAELHLNPAEMGPINVKIALDGQTAQVDFAAAALETRQAIEASLSMLHSALGDVGLNMTGGDVSSQTSQQSFNQSASQPSGTGSRPIGAPGEADASLDGIAMRAVAPPRPGRLGGLDLYA
jgi:flagellar hook-length control protein FliK